MAFDYDTANTGVFTQAGKIIKYLNSYLATASTTYPADLKAIADLFEAADRTDLVATLYGQYLQWQQGIAQQRQTLARYIDGILADPAEVLSQIGALTADQAEVLVKLWNQMIADSETIDLSTVTVGSVTADGGNTGDGTILVTKVLDGFNAPILGAIPNIGYNGIDSELAVNSETMVLTCIGDSGRDGLQAGAEQFSWDGGIKYDPFDWRTEGSGRGPGLTVANVGANRLTDGDFENWTDSSTPTNWTEDSGGSLIAQESSTVYRGTYAMKFTGDGATATIQASQAVSPSILRGRRMYCVSIRIRASTTPAAGVIGVEFNGTGYTPASSEKISIAAGAFPTSWTLYSFFISMPATIPSDWKLVIKVTSTLSNTVVVRFDDVCLTEVVYHGGVGAVAVAGATPFVVGDKFTFTLANDDAGVFQKFFRQWYRFQLPSDGSPSIADSLAT